jgi:hypothetical protein
MEPIHPSKQHLWLGRLIGDWTFSHDAPKTADARLTRIEGTESYRAIGALWVQGEAVAPEHDGSGMSVSITTLGWDPGKGRFVGTWLGSTMPQLWVYDGEIDADGRVLSLYCEGPSMDGTGALAPYKDVIEFLDDNRRTLTGHTKNADGHWTSFMTVEYRRR